MKQAAEKMWTSGLFFGLTHSPVIMLCRWHQYCDDAIWQHSCYVTTVRHLNELDESVVQTTEWRHGQAVGAWTHCRALSGVSLQQLQTVSSCVFIPSQAGSGTTNWFSDSNGFIRLSFKWHRPRSSHVIVQISSRPHLLMTQPILFYASSWQG